DLGKALRSAKSRAPLDDEVRAFNVAEPAQLSRERPKAWTGRFRNLRDWAHREDHCNLVDPSGLLCLTSSRRGEKRSQASDEGAAVHSITSSARDRSDRPVLP